MNRIKCFAVDPTEERVEVVTDGETRTFKGFRRIDTGDVKSLYEHGHGAMWWEDPREHGRTGPDGKMLVVVIPTNEGLGYRHWYPDSRASNCDRVNDDEHRCWCRHGDIPNITVDKNGNTCGAGAGSILVPGWHGFLRNGYLEH